MDLNKGIGQGISKVEWVSLRVDDLSTKECACYTAPPPPPPPANSLDFPCFPSLQEDASLAVSLWSLIWVTFQCKAIALIFGKIPPLQKLAQIRRGYSQSKSTTLEKWK